MSRDSQKQRVYDSEHMLVGVFDTAMKQDVPTFDFFGSVLSLPVERKFADVESIQRYVDAVLALNWVRGTWSQASTPIRVRARKSEMLAHYQYNEIAVPMRTRWALREIVVLHEIAHHLARGDGHGADFSGTHLALVTEIIGEEAGLIHRWAQDVNGVKINLKKVLQTS